METSEINRALVLLLRRWPRKILLDALGEHPQAGQAVLDGSFADHLSRRFPNATNKQLDNRLSGAPPSHDAVVGWFDEAFPALLRNIPDPPLLLFYRGNIKLLESPAVAVVGARRSTSQGRANAHTLARDLVAMGITVASGLALGIDGAAHSGALAGSPQRQTVAGGAHTIAVLGGGLKQMYPRRHQKLAQQIIDQDGLLLSEYEDGVPPLAHQFPERNRIISGLSLATVVVEATLRSGSLITARFAAEQGRDVFAMPGPVNNATSAGCHRLIQQGAGLVSNAEEVLIGIGQEAVLSAPATPVTLSPSSPNLDRDAQTLLDLINGYPMSLDELIVQSGLQPEHLTRLLVSLELGGFVQQGPLGYSRAS